MTKENEMSAKVKNELSANDNYVGSNFAGIALGAAKKRFYNKIHFIPNRISVMEFIRFNVTLAIYNANMNLKHLEEPYCSNKARRKKIRKKNFFVATIRSQKSTKYSLLNAQIHAHEVFVKDTNTRINRKRERESKWNEQNNEIKFYFIVVHLRTQLLSCLIRSLHYGCGCFILLSLYNSHL